MNQSVPAAKPVASPMRRTDRSRVRATIFVVVTGVVRAFPGAVGLATSPATRRRSRVSKDGLLRCTGPSISGWCAAVNRRCEVLLRKGLAQGGPAPYNSLR